MTDWQTFLVNLDLPQHLYRVTMGEAMPNTLGIARTIPVIFSPNNLDELRLVIGALKKNKLPFHCVSTGKNWGLGSYLPTTSDVAVLHLGKMNKILKYDAELGLVQIEPGVTQRQLADFLQNESSKFYLDVTGSSQHTSIVGNALERGISCSSQRHLQVIGFTVLTMSGEVLSSLPKVGSVENSFFGEGVGPDPRGIFFQSDLGVIVDMTLKLHPRALAEEAVMLSFSSDKFQIVFNKLQFLMQQGVVEPIPHLFNRERVYEIAEGIFIHKAGVGEYSDVSVESAIRFLKRAIGSEWLANVRVVGTKEVVLAKVATLRAEFKGVAKLNMVSAYQASFLKFLGKCGLKEPYFVYESLDNIRNLSKGKPTDDGLYALCSNNQDPDRSDMGFIYYLPFGPLSFSTADFFIETVDRVSRESGLQGALSLNMVNTLVLEAVWSIRFKKDDQKEKDQAQLAHQLMRKYCAERGISSYRLSPSHSETTDCMSPLAQRVYKIMKEYFDEDELISRGRWRREL